jgi:phenylpyruvate tautomerase PptA (4-oxalocrotonate tautomerase family)
MAQVKIYGEARRLRLVRDRLSDLIHECLCASLGLPPDKRFHRFIGLDQEDFKYPPDRTDAYTIIEISMFEGRRAATKRTLLLTLIDRITGELGLRPADLEITLFETPSTHWGIRGQTGDRLDLDYQVAGPTPTADD